MPCNVKIFIDFWNFQLAWNHHFPKSGNDGQPVKIDWKEIPNILLSELPQSLGPTAQQCAFRGAMVYASVNPNPGSKDAGLKKFLSNGLGQMTGYTVLTKYRKHRSEKQSDGNVISKTIEKGVDTQIVTDLFGGAINNSYDVALIVSNDSDYVPAIELIQDRLNKQILHVGFRSGSDAIRTACWSHIILDGDVAEKIKV